MNKQSSPMSRLQYVRWAARIFGTTLVLLFVIFLVSDIIGKGGLYLPDAGRWILTIFFLIAQAGLIIAWRWEGTGGLITAISIVIMILLNVFWVHAGKSHVAFLTWLIPALLFLYCRWKTRDFSNMKQT